MGAAMRQRLSSPPDLNSSCNASLADFLSVEADRLLFLPVKPLPPHDVDDSDNGSLAAFLTDGGIQSTDSELPSIHDASGCSTLASDEIECLVEGAFIKQRPTDTIASQSATREDNPWASSVFRLNADATEVHVLHKTGAQRQEASPTAAKASFAEDCLDDQAADNPLPSRLKSHNAVHSPGIGRNASEEAVANTEPGGSGGLTHVNMDSPDASLGHDVGRTAAEAAVNDNSVSQHEGHNRTADTAAASGNVQTAVVPAQQNLGVHFVKHALALVAGWYSVDECCATIVKRSSTTQVLKNDASYFSSTVAEHMLFGPQQYAAHEKIVAQDSCKTNDPELDKLVRHHLEQSHNHRVASGAKIAALGESHHNLSNRCLETCSACLTSGPTLLECRRTCASACSRCCERQIHTNGATRPIAEAQLAAQVFADANGAGQLDHGNNAEASTSHGWAALEGIDESELGPHPQSFYVDASKEAATLEGESEKRFTDVSDGQPLEEQSSINEDHGAHTSVASASRSEARSRSRLAKHGAMLAKLSSKDRSPASVVSDVPSRAEKSSISMGSSPVSHLSGGPESRSSGLSPDRQPRSGQQTGAKTVITGSPASVVSDVHSRAEKSSISMGSAPVSHFSGGQESRSSGLSPHRQPRSGRQTGAKTVITGVQSSSVASSLLTAAMTRSNKSPPGRRANLLESPG